MRGSLGRRSVLSDRARGPGRARWRGRRGAGQGGGVGAGLDMIVGATTQRRPSASTAPASAASASSTTRVAASSAYRRATPTTDDSWPSSVSRRSAGPLSAAPATMGDTATTSSRRATTACADARDGQHGPDRDDRVRRRDHHGRRPRAMASSTPGAGRARSAPSIRTRGHRHRVLAAARSTPGSQISPSPATVTRVRSSIVGHRQHGQAEAPRGDDLGRHLAAGVAPVAAAGLVR